MMANKTLELTKAPIHFHSSDERFCGSRVQGRAFSAFANDVTCPICRANDAAKAYARMREWMNVKEEDFA